MRKLENNPTVHWSFSYRDNKIDIKVISLKCSDIEFKRTYTCKEKIAPSYSESDIKEIKRIRDNLIEKVLKEHKNYFENQLDDFIKSHSGIWDLNDTKDFIIEHKKELLKIIKQL